MHPLKTPRYSHRFAFWTNRVNRLSVRETTHSEDHRYKTFLGLPARSQQVPREYEEQVRKCSHSILPLPEDKTVQQIYKSVSSLTVRRRSPGLATCKTTFPRPRHSVAQLPLENASLFSTLTSRGHGRQESVVEHSIRTKETLVI